MNVCIPTLRAEIAVAVAGTGLRFSVREPNVSVPEGFSEMLVPDTTAAGPPGAMLVPAIVKPCGLAAKI